MIIEKFFYIFIAFNLPRYLFAFRTNDCILAAKIYFKACGKKRREKGTEKYGESGYNGWHREKRENYYEGEWRTENMGVWMEMVAVGCVVVVM